MTNIIHAVGIIFENIQGQILVLKRHPSQPGGNLWGLVGGQVVDGKTVPQTAQEKSLTEIGFKLDPTRLLFINDYEWYQSDTNIVFDVYKYCLDNNSPQITLDPIASTEYLWDTPENLLQKTDLIPDLYLILQDVR